MTAFLCFCIFSAPMPLSPQETLEDLDRNKDGYVQVEEYIGEWAQLSP